jgi:hypothetical protein
MYGIQKSIKHARTHNSQKDTLKGTLMVKTRTNTHNSGGGMTIHFEETIMVGPAHISLVAADSKEKLQGQGCVSKDLLVIYL